METSEIVTLKNPVTESDHSVGSYNAAVTLVEYGNFECIHCGLAYPVIKQLRKLLGDDLLFVFRHFPTVKTHPHSLRAAEASEVAGAQGKFWEMHDQLFAHQTALEDTNLLRYAKRIGLDLETFKREMSEHTFLKKIEAEYQRSLFDEHVTGTPTIYINKVRYTGSTSLEGMLDAIRSADADGRIQLPERTGGLRNVLRRLRRGATS